MSKILITGLYDPAYPRNNEVIEAFKKVGEVTEWPLHSRILGGFKLMFYLSFSYKYKYVVVMQPAHFLLPFLSLVKYSPGHPKIIIDVFTSIYDTNISDRQLAGADSLKAIFYRWLDGLIAEAADGVFFDTAEHQDYFNLPTTICQAIVPVVPNQELITQTVGDKKFLEEGKVNVLFYGKYIPLQGVTTIVEATKILKDENNLHFTLIGSGQDYKQVKAWASQEALTNVTFYPKTSYEEIIATLKSADIALGVFGVGEKMQRVIPNKVIEALMIGTPLITGESKAVERYFKNNEHLFFVLPANPEALAQKIKEVTSDLPRAKQVALAGQTKALQDFTPNLVSERLADLLSHLA